MPLMGDRIARIERDGSQEFSLSAWKHHASIVSKRRTRTPWKVNPAKRPRLLVVPILRRIALCRVGGDCDVTFAPSCGLLQQSRARGSLAGVNLDSGDRNGMVGVNLRCSFAQAAVDTSSNGRQRELSERNQRLACDHATAIRRIEEDV
jgi:hypothetical protein